MVGTSYLFGTMHVKNNKAFNFKDSLYYFIEHSSGFAMEIHPDSAGQILTAIAEGRFLADDDPWDYSKDFDEKQYEKIVQKLSKGKKPAKGSPKEKISYLMEKLLDSKEENENGMETFMDAYLYGLALQNGKEIFGLEQVEDQIVAFRHLMKGIKVKRMAALADKGMFRESPPIYDYYYRENIDSIRIYYTTFFSDSTLKGFLYDRNINMAHQMDSLVKKQTMFFAVGAGHLPGKEGVINLLRQNGYVVEPVWSDKKIFAGDYVKKSIAFNWITYSNKQLGYQYQVPGKVTTQPGTNGREVNFYYNLPQGLVYMIIAGKLSATDKKRNKDSVFQEHTDPMLVAVNGKMISKKEREVNGMKGFEMMASSISNGYSRMIELYDEKNFYLLMLSAEKKDKLTNETAEQFINSFTKIPVVPPTWQTVDAPEGGFSIEFPGGSKAKQVKTEAEEQITVKTYEAYDGNSGINYTLYLSKAREGTQLMQGEWFFESYINSLKSTLSDTEIEQRDTMLYGYPAKILTSAPYDGKLSKGIMLRRDNISYLLFAEYDKEEKKQEDLDRFFGSFRLKAFPAAVWREIMSPDSVFRAWLPGTLIKEKEDTTYARRSPIITYYSTDNNSAVSCYVKAEPLSKYFWAANADSVYAYWKDKQYSGYADSVISFTNTKNGGLSTKELLVYDKNSKSITRHRLILNGRMMYTISKNIPPVFATEKEDNRFFESFAISAEEKNSPVFSVNPSLLFDDLVSADSTTFHEAYYALNIVALESSHLPLVLEKSLLEYPFYENDMYQTVNQKLLYIADGLSKESKENTAMLTEFIRSHYNLPGNATASHRYHLLGLLANMKTTASFQLLSALMDSNPPAGDDAYQLFYKLTDSLALSRTLFPSLLKYVSDSSSGMPMLGLAKTLIDSNLLSTDDVRPVQPEMLKLAAKSLHAMVKLKADDYDYDYEITDVISLLGYLNNKQANDAIAGFMKVKIIPVKYQAVISLLKNGQPVSATEIKKLAADKAYRLDLYEALFKINKTVLMPSEYTTQQAIGESYIYKAVDDVEEEGPLDLIYIKTVEQEYKGSRKKFFLYRVNIGEQEDHAGEPESPDTETYLAIAGPFDMDIKKPLLKEGDNISGIYYDKKFDGSKLDDFFNKYLAALLKNNP